MKTNTACPICYTHLSQPLKPLQNKTWFDCPRCGRFELTTEAVEDAPNLFENQIDLRPIVSHQVRLQARGQNKPPLLDNYLLERMSKANLLTPHEKLDNLILWIGKHGARNAAQLLRPTWAELAGEIGADDDQEAIFIGDAALTSGMIEGIVPPSGPRIRLSMSGWEKIQRLETQEVEGRTAFMAMQFGSRDLDQIYDNCFRPAVKETGFDLATVADNRKAGLIDDHIRLEIRKARFIVADLTHDNNGAYWEAGFAEGLGKHVIYTCEKSKFEKAKTHFDTNHRRTVTWDLNDMPGTAEELKATIRATLPGEAKLTDI